jgi:hypothetical protein
MASGSNTGQWSDGFFTKLYPIDKRPTSEPANLHVITVWRSGTEGTQATRWLGFG